MKAQEWAELGWVMVGAGIGYGIVAWQGEVPPVWVAVACGLIGFALLVFAEVRK